MKADVLQGFPSSHCFCSGIIVLILSIQDVVPEWQGAAAALLTTLGISHAPAVLQELLKRFQPGTTPHYFVVKTTGDLAMANGIALSCPFFVQYLQYYITRA